MPHKNPGADMGAAFLAIRGVTARDWHLDAAAVETSPPSWPEPEWPDLPDMPIWLWVTGTTVEVGDALSRIALNDDRAASDAALRADAAQGLLGEDVPAPGPQHDGLPALAETDMTVFIRLSGVPDADGG